MYMYIEGVRRVGHDSGGHLFLVTNADEVAGCGWMRYR